MSLSNHEGELQRTLHAGPTTDRHDHSIALIRKEADSG